MSGSWFAMAVLGCRSLVLVIILNLTKFQKPRPPSRYNYCTSVALSHKFTKFISAINLVFKGTAQLLNAYETRVSTKLIKPLASFTWVQALRLDKFIRLLTSFTYLSTGSKTGEICWAAHNFHTSAWSKALPTS